MPNEKHLIVLPSLVSDTAANWAASTIILKEGVVVLESDTGKKKVGDGVNAYSSLSYQSEPKQNKWINITDSIISINTGANTITLNNTPSVDDILINQPIKFRNTNVGAWQYAYVTNKVVSTNTVLTLKGKILFASLENLSVGNIENLVQLDLFVPEDFSSDVNANILESKANTFFTWNFPTADIVSYSARSKVGDGGAANPTINIAIGSTNIVTTALGVRSDQLTVLPNIANTVTTTKINPGNEIKISLVTTGTNKGSENLTVSILFVVN
jgi:hypothetical protein